MVIGNGMLAHRFASYQDNEHVVIFASGVTNSKETSPSEFAREAGLLASVISSNPSKILVYLSTSAIYDSTTKNSQFVKHKLLMENYVKQHVKSFYIFRVSQIIGRANNTTLINYILNTIDDGLELTIWSNATRNLIALDDVYHIIDAVLLNGDLRNQIINIANPNNIRMVDLVKDVIQVYQKPVNLHLIDAGGEFEQINIDSTLPFIESLGIQFNEDYYLNALKNIM